MALGACLAAALFAGSALCAPYATAAQPILIGGGPSGGVHTQAARQICALVNEHVREQYGCIARPAPGSAFNIRAIGIGLMDFGLAAWDGKPQEDLRSVFRLYPETMLLVTSADVAEDLVYDIVRTVFMNLDVLRGAHPALQELAPAAMLKGLSAPLHPGAARYYREQGWL